MKKHLLAVLAFAVFACVPAFAAPKKSSAPEETSPTAWAKKSKVFSGKQVFTYVEEIGAAGYANADAPFVVVPVKTATANGKSNGRILALIPFSAFEKFGETYAPKHEKGGSTFGKRAKLKKLSGVFTLHKKTPVLLVGISTDALKDAPDAAEQLETQLAAEAKATGNNKSSREGYTKKIFRAEAIWSGLNLSADFFPLL